MGKFLMHPSRSSIAIETKLLKHSQTGSALPQISSILFSLLQHKLNFASILKKFCVKMLVFVLFWYGFSLGIGQDQVASLVWSRSWVWSWRGLCVGMILVLVLNLILYDDEDGCRPLVLIALIPAIMSSLIWQFSVEIAPQMVWGRVGLY